MNIELLLEIIILSTYYTYYNILGIMSLLIM